MPMEDLEPHIKEISQLIGGKVSEDEISKELDTYLKVYRVPLETAKKSIVRKYGGNPSLVSRGQKKEISELTTNEQSVDLLVKVVSVNKREVEVDGTIKPVLYGVFADESGAVPFTAWEADRFDFKKGDVIFVRNAYTREWNGQPQVNLGNRAVVEKKDSATVEISEVEVPSFAESVQAKVSQLKDGMNNVAITGRILELEMKVVSTPDGAKPVTSGIIADETGKVQFSAWHDFGLREDMVITIKGAYVKGWRGIPQINFGQRADVTEYKGSFPAADVLAKPAKRTIEDLEKIGGGIDVLVSGVVVDIREGSGLILRCPKCKRVVQKNLCRLHGSVNPEPDLRIKAVVDDGEGVLTVIMNRTITESITGISLNNAMRRAKEMMNPLVIKEDIENLLIAHPVEVSGNVTRDEFGLLMIASDARLAEFDIRSEATEMLTKLEGMY